MQFTKSKKEKKNEYFEKYRDSTLQNSIAISNKVYEWIKKYVEDPIANLIVKKIIIFTTQYGKTVYSHYSIQYYSGSVKQGKEVKEKMGWKGRYTNNYVCKQNGQAEPNTSR